MIQWDVKAPQGCAPDGTKSFGFVCFGFVCFFSLSFFNVLNAHLRGAACLKKWPRFACIYSQDWHLLHLQLDAPPQWSLSLSTPLFVFRA